MKFLIVDNNFEDVGDLTRLIRSCCKSKDIAIDVLDTFSSGIDLLNRFSINLYDVAFLETNLEDINGVFLAKRIREIDPDIRIVFCSKDNSYAYESYQLNASYYIRKPVDEESIYHTLNRIDVNNIELKRYIIMPDSQKLLLRGVISAEMYNHKIIVVLKNNRELYFWISFKELEKILSPYPYLASIRAGVLVNMYEVVRFEGTSITMSNKSVFFVSASRKKNIYELYLKYKEKN